MTAQTISTSKGPSLNLAVFALLGLAAGWAYWTTLNHMAWRWSADPQYSHGYLVPAFALYLLWVRRDRLNPQALRISWLGIGLLGLAIGLRLAGTYTGYEYFDQVSLLPCI